jgi:hypothetical protein
MIIYIHLLIFLYVIGTLYLIVTEYTKYCNKIVTIFVDKYIQTNFKEIDVWSGKALFNQRCHKNAVQYAVENKQNNIVCCFYKNLTENNQQYYTHYVNVDEFGQYTDNSIGHFSLNYEYRFVELVNRQDFLDIETHIGYYKHTFINTLDIPWYIKKIPYF